MLVSLVNILYVLVAVAMIVLILLQRGAGASAGSGFGAGASATVFCARGSANFLCKSTAVLATLFFAISLGMAIAASRGARDVTPQDDLGVMGSAPAAATDMPVVDGEAPATESAMPVQDAELPAADVSAASAEVPSDAPVESDATDEKEQGG